MRRAQTGNILERSENNVAHVMGTEQGFPCGLLDLLKQENVLSSKPQDTLYLNQGIGQVHHCQ